MVAIKFSQADWANVDSPQADYAHLADLIGKGTPWKAAQKLSGVGYASGWLFVTRLNLPAEDRIAVDPAKPEEAVKAIRHARLVDGDSWGRLMARTGLPEGQVRACFTEATNLQSEGLRNGRGGRFLQGNAEAYAPAPKVGWVRPTEAGVTLPAEIVAGLVEAGALAAGDAEEIEAMSLKDLKGMAKAMGLKATGKKAELVARIAEAYAN